MAKPTTRQHHLRTQMAEQNARVKGKTLKSRRKLSSRFRKITENNNLIIAKLKYGTQIK